MSEKLGIEKIKNALISSITLGEKIEKNLSDDGKLSWAEALSIGVSSVGDIVKIAQSAKEIKAEFLDLDESEKQEIKEIISNELDLENDKLENIIEKAFDFLNALDSLIRAF